MTQIKHHPPGDSWRRSGKCRLGDGGRVRRYCGRCARAIGAEDFRARPPHFGRRMVLVAAIGPSGKEGSQGIFTHPDGARRALDAIADLLGSARPYPAAIGMDDQTNVIEILPSDDVTTSAMRVSSLNILCSTDATTADFADQGRSCCGQALVGRRVFRANCARYPGHYPRRR